MTEAPVWGFLILRHFSGFSLAYWVMCLHGYYVCLHVSGVPWGFCHVWSPPNWEQLLHIARAYNALPTDLRVLPVWTLPARTTHCRCCPLGMHFVKRIQANDLLGISPELCQALVRNLRSFSLSVQVT